MKILTNLGNLKDGRTALVIKDAYNPNYAIVRYAIVRGYNPDKAEWDSATYFGGNLMSFIDEVLEIEKGISFSSLKSMFEQEIEDVDDVSEHFDLMGWDPDDAAIFGYAIDN